MAIIYQLMLVNILKLQYDTCVAIDQQVDVIRLKNDTYL